MSKKKAVLILVAVIAIVSATFAVALQQPTPKPKFHLFDINMGEKQYKIWTVGNTTQESCNKTLTFNIQNLGDVDATNVILSFNLHLESKSIPQIQTWDEIDTYAKVSVTYPLLKSGEVRYDKIEIISNLKQQFNPHYEELVKNYWNASDALLSSAKITPSPELFKFLYNYVNIGTDLEVFQPTEETFTLRINPPTSYTITCKEGVYETVTLIP